MSIFSKIKSYKSNTTAPVTQEKSVASESENKTEEVIINVMSYGNENWVHPSVSPKFPIPRTETATFDKMPLKNCAVPAGWWFSEYSDDQELVFQFPNDERELLTFAYGEPTINIQYVTIKYEPSGLIFASAWGYNRTNNAIWQTVVKFDVIQTFKPYIQLIDDNTPSMDVRLCSDKFVYELLHGSPLRVRAAYQQTYETAEETFELLTSYVASAIVIASKGLFKHTLQIKADRQYASVEMSVKMLEDIISETENLTTHIAIKKFYGIGSDITDWRKAQNLLNKFLLTANEFDETSIIFSQLRYACKVCEISIDMKHLSRIREILNTGHKGIVSLFDYMRS